MEEPCFVEIDGWLVPEEVLRQLGFEAVGSRGPRTLEALELEVD